MLAPWATHLPLLLAAGVGALLLVHIVVSRRRILALEAQLKQRCDLLGRELHANVSGNVGMGHRIVDCERQLHELRRTLEEMRQNDPLRVTYDEASRLVELGADIDDLMNTCGISRPEAELVSALKRKQVA
ncbi:DUF2802 domain-containing protein [Marinobacter sp. X15-166B]|uniref:DUF2802 domain-containing protein n=1 Tax=Marinobacter sp. X15-166B TaxID=1897620 RepID=UPI00085CDCE7|nr:DUF2802 domain-containing protein [Marinobacter sp. X15-166B]OEY67094.1 hypothetical protein BG841_11920 [Marinobacter sp. X15-166B]